ncbi:uncharacterized protein LOC100967919 [Pan paniscus]|uniref:uncharacterized protein LOC100967919 n=1 Tax=Pan paniscus TaxID=9597 RepID=UPI003007147A
MKRFAGTKEGQTSKCWPSSPRKMRPPPTLSLRLLTVTVSFTRTAARERKREASEIPEWIDRCYVIGAASSTPQEARSWGERGSPAAGATRTVSPPHRSLELAIQEEAASFVFWCHRRWPPMAFGLWESSFSPGAGGFCTTLPPSFLRVDDRATSSTTDSSRAHWKLRVLTAAGHIGKEAGACSVSGQGYATFVSSSSRQHKPLWNLHRVYRTVPLRPATQDLSSPRCDGSSA